MRLFISWSGGRSHRLAVVLKEWLERHFEGHGIRAFVSSEIPKGSLWLPVVNAELQRADAGLVCLTAQSLDSDWALFEAGALSTAVALRTGEARIFTYLLGVDPAALPSPLSVYQSTVAAMEDTFRLINSLLGHLKYDPMDIKAFAPIWDDLWPRLQRIEDEPVTSVFPGLADLFKRKTFQEPVDESTDQSWFWRYDAAVAARDALQAQNALVAAECDARLADRYRHLMAAVDGYAVEMRALLFEQKKFDLADDGRLAIPRGVRAGLERRRLDVRQLVAEIIDRRAVPDAGPILPYSEPAMEPTPGKSEGAESHAEGAWRHQPDATVGMTAFVSYSHKDVRYRQSLDISLAQLRRDKLISIWHDRKILPGQKWDQEIDENLNSAGLVLLLVSPDFLASEYAYTREMSRALERCKSGSAIVVPIILRPSDWKNSPLRYLQALPEGNPVSRWPNRDEAWLNVVHGLRQLISEQS